MAEEARVGGSRSLPRAVWWLLLLLAAVVVAAVFWAMGRFERDLASEARLALQAEGLDVEVAVEGRDAVLSGTLASQLDIDRAVLVVKEIEGVRVVDAESVVVALSAPPTTTTTTAPEHFPAVVEIAIGDSQVSLAGLVPAEHRAALLAAAKLSYGSAGVTDNLQVDQAVAAPDWLEALPEAFAEFGVIDQANIVVGDQGLEITGIVKQADDVEAIGIRLAQITKLQVTNQLAFTSLPAPSIAAAAAEGSVSLSGELSSQEAIDSILSAVAGRFETIDNELELAEVADAAWVTLFPQLVEAVDAWPSWAVEIGPGVATFTGFAPSAGDIERLSIGALQEFGFDWHLDGIEVDPAAVAVELTAAVAGRIIFESGSSVLSSESTVVLDDVIEMLQRNPSTRLEVQGYTDDVGSADSNQRLSEARAQAVVDYLVAGGVDPGRLAAVGLGEQNPIAGNGTAAGRAQNRRIEFVVTTGGGSG